MPICIECRYPVPQLYHISHASKKPATASLSSTNTGGGSSSNAIGGEAKRSGASGGDVRLTQCPRCKRFADKYVEHDFVVLFIDLVLVKPQVYRHLLFNRLGRDDDAFDPSITRLGVLLLLFDVYLTWSSIEGLPSEMTASSPLPNLPILIQYAFYLLLCAARTVAQHLTIRFLTQRMALAQQGTSMAPNASVPSATSTPALQAGATAQHPGPFSSPPMSSSSATGFTGPHLPPHQSYGVSGVEATPGPNAISTALFVSSCMKLFPILMVVWKYDDTGGQLARGVSWVVAVQNVEALRILLGCSYWVAGLLVGAGAVARWLVSGSILGVVGLGGLEL